MTKYFNKIIKSQIRLAVLSLFAVVLLITSVSYALFQKENPNSENQTISIGELDAALTSTSGSTGIVISDIYPTSESSVGSANTYTFTVTNTGDYALNYEVYLSDNTAAIKAGNANYSSYTAMSTSQYGNIDYKLDSETSSNLGTLYTNNSRMVILTGFLNPGANETHTIQFWLDENATNDMIGTILALNINLSASATERKTSPYTVISQAGASLTTGDKIAIGDENFWVISNTNGTIRALAEYNINVGSNKNPSVAEGVQDESVKGNTFSGTSYGTIAFSNSGTSYSGSLLEGYINDYIDKLEDDYGVSGISGDAITLNELETLGCSSSSNSCSEAPSWVHTTSYWSGSALDSSEVWNVDTVNALDNSLYMFGNYYGVRPVVVISES